MRCVTATKSRSCHRYQEDELAAELAAIAETQYFLRLMKIIGLRGFGALCG